MPDLSPDDRLRSAATALRTGMVDVCAGDLVEPLAAWLEQEGASADRHVPVWQREEDRWPDVYEPHAGAAGLVEHHYGPALAVADVILGGGHG